MSISIEALKEAIQIKETIQNLEARLLRIFGGKASAVAAAIKVPRATRGRKKRKLSAEGRAAIIAAQAKRWADKKKGTKAAAASAAPKKKRKLSAEGRARIIAAQKKRWAAKKKS